MGYLHFYYILTGAAALIFSMAPEAERLAGVDPRTDPIVNAHADALADLLFPESPQLTDLTDLTDQE